MGRKKPTPTTLFDEYERNNDGYKKRAESLYEFLNRCAGAAASTFASVHTRGMEDHHRSRWIAAISSQGRPLAT